MSEFKRAMVAGTYDPVTTGHIDIVRRAKERSEEVLVLVAHNPLKKPLFSLDERIGFMTRAVRNACIPRVRIIGSERLLVDVYMKEDCDVRLVGVRNQADIDYETALNGWNTYLYSAFRMQTMDAREELRLVSSSAIKQIVLLDGDVSPFVDMSVKAALEEKLRGHGMIGITGGISVGKSWVAKEVARHLTGLGLAATHINIDELIREFYAEASPAAQRVRDNLEGWFGTQVLLDGRGDVDRKVLSARLFTDSCAKKVRENLVAMTMPHVERLYRGRLLAAPEGIVLLEWAQMAEMHMTHWTNNRVVVVESSDREAFAAKRGIDPARLAEWSKFQWTADAKHAAVCDRISEARFGSAWLFNNRIHHGAARDIQGLADQIAREFPALTAPKTP